MFEAERLLARGARHALREVDEVFIGRGPTRSVQRTVTNGVRQLVLTFPSRSLSARHAHLMRVGANWQLVDRGSTNGTFVNGARVEQAELADGDFVDLGRVFLRWREGLTTGADDSADFAGPDLGTRGLPGAFATLLPHLATEFLKLEAVARSNLTIALGGMTGVGKEVIARTVHESSGRAGPFVPVNCSAIPPHLVESTLFGHAKGAFSGATSNELGLVRAAERGTLFLDEVGDMPLPAQAALLRVLQESEVLPVGSSKPVRVDVRIISATHRPLRELIQQGNFRADLFARLMGFGFQIPTLHDRIEDLGLLLAARLQATLAEQASRVMLSSEAARLLVQYSWPFNVRELDLALRRAVTLASDGRITPSHLPEALVTVPTPTGPTESATPGQTPPERERLERLMSEHRGNVAAVARALKTRPTQLRRWLKRYGVELDAFR